MFLRRNIPLSCGRRAQSGGRSHLRTVRQVLHPLYRIQGATRPPQMLQLLGLKCHKGVEGWGFPGVQLGFCVEGEVLA